MDTTNNYDIVIIGGGLGGLECGVILSKEGYNVCVLEQGAVIGGCLQTFHRRGVALDTGIHYVGSMGEGQIMRQYFKYFGIWDDLKVTPMDSDFDIINLAGVGEFAHCTGYQGFTSELISKFPHEKEGILRYAQYIESIGSSINVDIHANGRFMESRIDNLSISAVLFINDCVKDPLLRQVLVGSNVLCGATKDTMNMYHHSMITHSNIEGPYRFVGGTQQIADLLVAQIRNNGGEVLTNHKVTRIAMQGDEVSFVETLSGEQFYAKQFISNIHPAPTFAMLDSTPLIKKAYRSRLNGLKNTYSVFTTYLALKENYLPYNNKNYYYYKGQDVWDIEWTNSSVTPPMAFVSSQKEHADSTHSRVISLMTPVSQSLFEPFASTNFGKRGKDYRELKLQLADSMIDFVCEYNPNLRDAIDHVYTASPLTYEHYTATPNGSAYGILKGYEHMISTLIPVKTKIKNLFLTGQNLNVHGAIGVTLTAASTCAEFLGMEYLAKKIAK